MIRKKLLPSLAICVICSALALIAGSAAQGAKPTGHHHGHRHARLPANFFGINPNSGTPSAAEFARMRAGGIRTFRTPVYWRGMNYAPGVYTWISVDIVMRRAAKAGIDVLPFIYDTPHWVNPKEERTMPVGTPAQQFAWATFLGQLVARYGPHGTFWRLNPKVPYSPIRFWQIWNEMNIDSFTVPISPTGYARLLKLSRATLDKVDPGAKIVIGGLFGEPYQPQRHGDMNDIAFMRQLYRVKGVKSAFDAYALHPYGASVRVFKRQIRNTRALMRRSGDGKTPLWIDEFGWGSEHDRSLPSSVGPQGQKKQLQLAYGMMRKNRARWRIGRTYWFSWDDDPVSACAICSGSGLFRASGKPKPAWFAFVKQTGGKS
jgi:hypothetical protein